MLAKCGRGVEVAACMTAVEQGLSEGEMMRRLMAEDYAVDAVTMAKALALACPLGGMLWHFHDMQAGFFPNFWLRKLLGGFADGLMIGPRLIFYSFPYNLMGVIFGYLATSCLNSFFYQMNGEVKGKSACHEKEKEVSGLLLVVKPENDWGGGRHLCGSAWRGAIHSFHRNRQAPCCFIGPLSCSG